MSEETNTGFKRPFLNNLSKVLPPKPSILQSGNETQENENLGEDQKSSISEDKPRFPKFPIASKISSLLPGKSSDSMKPSEVEDKTETVDETTVKVDLNPVNEDDLETKEKFPIFHKVSKLLPPKPAFLEKGIFTANHENNNTDENPSTTPASTVEKDNEDDEKSKKQTNKPGFFSKFNLSNFHLRSKSRSQTQENFINLYLIKSKALEYQNLNMVIATLVIFISWFLSILVQILRYAFGNSSTLFHNSTIQIVLYFVAFAIMGHRILGYSLGFLIRRLLRKSFENNGKFDIHFGWVSLRGILDRNQIVIHNVVWRNPPEFKNSPFLLHIKELSVSVDPSDIISTIRDPSSVKIEEIVIDGVEIFIEKSDSSKIENSLNLWSAVGAESKEKENETFKSIITEIFHKISSKIKEKLKGKAFHVKTSDNSTNEEVVVVPVDITDSDTNSGTKPDLDTKSAPPRKTGSVPPTVELNRLLVFDLVLHPLDLLGGSHQRPTPGSDITLPLLCLTREDLTGPPAKGDIARTALHAPQFVDRIVDGLVPALLSANTLSIPRLLGSSMINQTFTAMSRIGSRDKSDK
jgi:hypothetical protein